MDTVRERNTCRIPISFLDEEGNTVVPDEVTYRIDDESSGDAVVAEGTDITGQDYILVTADQNAIITETNDYEVRRVTITWLYGGSTKEGNIEYFYKIQNLMYVSTTTTTTTPAP